MKKFMVIAVPVFGISMVIFPQETFEAATLGLSTWWNIVFPSLLPFFIVGNLLLSLGVVNFLSVLLEPVMRPLFNLPGAAAFVVTLGFTSGFPVGAYLTANLRKNKLCTRLEGERLMAFTHNASPLFMFVAVSVGMLNRPSLGIAIAGAHYLANITMGLLLRFYGRHDPEKQNQPSPQGNLLVNSLAALIEAQKKDPRPAGRLLGDAIKNAVYNLSTIGGFIILFAVIIRIFSLWGGIALITGLLSTILGFLHFPDSLIASLSQGLFEITLGIKLAAESEAPLFQQLTAVCILLAWSGLSIHAQVASMIADTDMRMYPYFFTRICQAALSGLFIHLLVGKVQPTFFPMVNDPIPSMSSSYYILYPLIFGLFMLLLLALFVTGYVLVSGTCRLIIFKLKH